MLENSSQYAVRASATDLDVLSVFSERGTGDRCLLTPSDGKCIEREVGILMSKSWQIDGIELRWKRFPN